MFVFTAHFAAIDERYVGVLKVLVLKASQVLLINCFPLAQQ